MSRSIKKKFKYFFTFGNNEVFISLMLPKATRGLILNHIRQGMNTEDLELKFDVLVNSISYITKSWVDSKGVIHREYRHETFINTDVTFGAMLF